MGTIRVFDPTSRNAEREIRLAPRPPSLRGLRIGLVENTKYNSSTLLLRINGFVRRDRGGDGPFLGSARL
jgi:hypothetical protein